MSRSVLMILGGVVVIFAGGCSGAADAPSNAPDLAGNWRVQSEDGADDCWEFDATGDPLRVSTESAAGLGGIGIADLTEITLDGSTQPLDLEGLGASVSGGGSASQTGSQATVEATITLSLGFVGASSTIRLEGTIDGDTWSGQMTTTASALGTEAEQSSSNFTASRNGC